MKRTNEPSLPDFLTPRHERALRNVVRGIVAANPGHRDAEARVLDAMSALLGKPKRRGPRTAEYHELLEWIAFDYSVETQWKQQTDVSVTSVVRRVVEHHPSTADKAHRESIVRNLERTFSAHRDELVELHGYDGSEGFDEYYGPIVRALRALRESGVPVDLAVVPPLAVNGDNSAK